VRGKGVDTLLLALARIPDAELVLAGAGRQEQQLRRLAQSLGLDGRVRFAGKLQQEALADLLGQATVATLPSRTPETFGLAGLEALARGTPVVATDVGGISQWLVHEKNGLLVPPNQPAALAAALTRVLDAPAWARRLGRAGQVDCRQRFSPPQHAERLIRMFGTLVRPRVAGASR
jgi:glycosyltransferase involved in cell wall biosynthesis